MRLRGALQAGRTISAVTWVARASPRFLAGGRRSIAERIAAVRAAAKTAIFLLKVFPMLPSRPLDWVTPRPVVERFRYPTSHGHAEGDLYRPCQRAARTRDGGLPGRRAVRRRSPAGTPPRARRWRAPGSRRCSTGRRRCETSAWTRRTSRTSPRRMTALLDAAGHRPGAQRPARHLRRRRLRPDGRGQSPHPRPRRVRVRVRAVRLDVDAGAGHRQRHPRARRRARTVGGRPADPQGLRPFHHRAPGARRGGAAPGDVRRPGTERRLDAPDLSEDGRAVLPLLTSAGRRRGR